MSDELRNLIRTTAERVAVPADDVSEVLRGGRSLKWRKRLYAGASVVVVAVLVWSAVPNLLASMDRQERPPITGTPTSTPTAGSTPTERPCETVPFRPSYLPDGWSYVLQPGGGGETDPPVEDSPGPLAHYTVSRRMVRAPYVDVAFYGESYVLPPGEGDPIEVLGDDGRIGAIHEGYAAEFSYGECEYSLVAFGLSQQQLRRIAEGLRPADTCTGQPVSDRNLNLPDGKHFGYIRAIDGPASIEFDPAEFLTGGEANDAAEAAGEIEEGEAVPNDYFIRNADKSTGSVNLSTGSLNLAQDVNVLVETVSMDGSVGAAPADITWLVCAFGSDDPIHVAHARSPYWITVKNGEVTRIKEQYLP